MSEDRTQNLLKNPASGGMPAVESSNNEKVVANSRLCWDNEIQFIIYFGLFLLILASIIMQKIARLAKMYKTI